MLLNLTTTHQPASDLGFLLHKHPDKFQSTELPFGTAHVFYPEATAARCTASLLLDIDPVALVRNGRHEAFSLGQYVNDRPYATSSFLSAAIAKVFSSALNGNCKNRPELVEVAMPFEVQLPSVSAPRGGEVLIRKLFEPLGYEVGVTHVPLDEKFPEWGESRYYSLTLRHTVRLHELLSHLYVLIPVLDNNKHYYVGENEVEKLLEKGGSWLPSHPEKEQITRRYLRHHLALTRAALARLLESENEEEADEETEETPAAFTSEEQAAAEAIIGRRRNLHDERLDLAAETLVKSGAKRVLDLGCGEGKLLQRLIKYAQVEEILGMDVSYRSLAIAKRKLNFDQMSSRQKERINLVQGSLLYRDKRLGGFDAAAVIEVIEHMEADRLAAFERVLFEFARPKTVVVTTPNAEYNEKYETLSAGRFRHDDHRFEWTRAEFESWAKCVAEKNNYEVAFQPVGEYDEKMGAPSQMAVFTYGN